MFSFKKKTKQEKQQNQVTLSFEYFGDEVTLKDAEGLFMFEGMVFFKVNKNASAKNLETLESFSTSVKKLNKYKDLISRDISKLMVQPINKC